MTHTETEAKLELSAEAYYRLQGASHALGQAEILNVYYDAGGALASRAITFRVRHTSGGQTEATLKIPRYRSGVTRVAVETTWPARRLAPRLDVERDLPAPCHRPLIALGVSHLDRIGWMRTLRTVVTFSAGAAVELDRVQLPGGRAFYEVEVESSNPSALSATVEAIRVLAPEAIPSILSKYERFIQAIAALEETPNN